MLPGDQVHESAKALDLAVGEQHTIRVHSKLRYNWSGLFVKQNAEYRASVPPSQIWEDKDIQCGSTGWETKKLPWYSEGPARVLEMRRRVRDANWFHLCGALGDEDDDVFAVLTDGGMFKPNRDAELYFFANDLLSKYDNNEGFLDVTIERIA
jgi:hypothetical protein